MRESLYCRLYATPSSLKNGTRHQHHQRYRHPDPGYINLIQPPVSSLLLLALEHCCLPPQPLLLLDLIHHRVFLLILIPAALTIVNDTVDHL